MALPPKTGKKTSPPRSRQPAATKRRPALLQRRRPNWALLALETIGLACAALLGTMQVLASSARHFSGTGFLQHLLPFATSIALWIVAAAGGLLAWLALRKRLPQSLNALPAILALAIGAGSWQALAGDTDTFLEHFRSLVGGKQRANRTMLAHQIYAAYRRQELGQLQKLILRAQPFRPDIEAAAQAFSLNPNLLQGIAAAESSFLPRTSIDGGRGLFQITAVPKASERLALQKLGNTQLNLALPRHNAFVAAATLQHYLAEMQDDLFLGLLAYNIGPANGGLRFIMQQYGAGDFAALQPYLQQLPRDYPIRVLTYALAFEIWQHFGRLLPYAEHDNAKRIQRLAIPGLASDF